MSKPIPDKNLKALEALEAKITRLLEFSVESIKDGIVVDLDLNLTSKEATLLATNKIADGEENFDCWLPLTVSTLRTYSFDLTQLQRIRDNSRSLVASQIYKNIIKHYQAHLVADGLVYTLIKKDKGQDPAEQAKETKDDTITKLIDNWEKFEEKNKFNERLTNIVERALRDGESPLRLFKDVIPNIRFLEPALINPSANQTAKNTTEYERTYGVKTKPNDIESIISYCYNSPQDTAETTKITSIPAEDVIFIKRNTDFDFPRGVSDFWPIATNIRRYEKILQNTSVLIQIQSAIALIRKHKGTTQAKVGNFVRNTSDGQQRTDKVTGKTVMSRNFRPGMILDSSESIEYDFPSANIDTKNFIAGGDQELQQIAINFVLPLEWLKASEPQEPLRLGSPTVKNFQTEQGWLYSHVEDVFWRVQKMMGIDTDKIKEEYELIITGPLLGIGKPDEEATKMQILQQCAAVSPQTISATFGLKYNVERANTIRHRDSLQPGEVAPGDLGNTDPGNNTGVDNKKDGVKKKNNAPGGKP